jgi:16S rRNA processing protein RimM
MLKEDCFELGHVTKLHGYKGAVKFFLDTDAPQEYSNLESIFLEVSGNLTPFFIESISVNKNQAVIQFEGVKSEEDALALVKAGGYLPTNILPALDENHFYFHEVIGFKVEDREKGDIGVIEDVIDLSSNVLLKINFNDTEILAPTNTGVNLKVDRENSKIILSCPPGLLDMYLNA